MLSSIADALLVRGIEVRAIGTFAPSSVPAALTFMFVTRHATDCGAVALLPDTVVMSMGANVSDHDDVQDVLDGIRRIVQGLHRSSRAGQQRTGLSGAQLFVLRRLADTGPLSVNELARRTFTHQSSVSTVVSRLQARRFVRSCRDPRDRRKRILTLTPPGRSALAGAPHAAQECLIDAVRDLPARTARTLARALNGIADGMAAARQPGMFFEDGGRNE